jgi:hypothetical protein
MRDWVVILVLYVLALGFFRILGGFGAAADAFRRWGNASSDFRTNPGSSS